MQPHYYAVIDTNVWVSAALKWQSYPGRVISLVATGVITLIANNEILEEYQDVLSRTKLNISPQIVATVCDVVEHQSVFLDGKPVSMVFPDEDDRVFYEVVATARESSDAYLVTGNTRDFPVETFVVTPRQMVEVVESELATMAERHEINELLATIHAGTLEDALNQAMRLPKGHTDWPQPRNTGNTRSSSHTKNR